MTSSRPRDQMIYPWIEVSPAQYDALRQAARALKGAAFADACRTILGTDAAGHLGVRNEGSWIVKATIGGADTGHWGTP